MKKAIVILTIIVLAIFTHQGDVATAGQPPTQPSVTIAPALPKTADNLVATASGSTDADGDPITYKYAWYKNGVVQASLTTNTVASSNTAKGQVWKCVVTPNDGKADGVPGET